jgi:RES domain-containing protein
MKFYRITTCDHVNDLSGEGAYLHGGRWNSKGTRILYTAESMALSMIEALAHITMVNQKRAYCWVVLEANGLVEHQPGALGEEELQPAPENWFGQIDVDDLPADFRTNPGPDALRAIGDQFIAEGKYLALKVPSVVVPDSFNYLLNPGHALFNKLMVENVQEVSFDQRLVGFRHI